MKTLLICLLIFFKPLFQNPAFAAIEKSDTYHAFIKNMVEEHNFNANDLDQLFQSVDIKQSIIETMQRPAEGMPWHKYRKIFLTQSRINSGVKFWQEHASTLEKVSQETGVPSEIIVAIIGVETLYGKHTGNHRVIDALATLGFNYPKRSKFFLSELKHFLILCRDQKINPLKPTGSYAGAMGIPQFMPSSYRHYSADFENDNKIDIWSNPADAISSVANYFIEHRWKKNQPIAFPVTSKSNKYESLLSKGLKPENTWKQALELNISAKNLINPEEKIKLLQFELEKGQSLWVGLHNFYVITRYNHSPLYALAVFQLSEEIRQSKNGK